MWDLGNRDIIVLVSVISGWAILLNIFGPYLASGITFGLVVCGWVTYIVTEDTPFTPHALLILDYIEQALGEFNRYLKSGYQQFAVYIAHLIHYVYHLYRVNIAEKMAQRRRSTYQLSSETRASSRNASRFSLVDGLSPIPRGTFRQVGNSTNAENTPFLASERRRLERANSVDHVTSTPLISWRKEDARNGDVFSTDHAASERSVWRSSPSLSQTRALFRGEEPSYSPEGSPWGTSISPKMRGRAAGVKTVQTVAGPLLASTRYNIDPKVYTDVTSPGLTTRLTRYANEANTKLTHQSQYRTGQFPRVNLYTSPMPLINTKTGKLRSPVTVRIAPPENTRYSPPERQQLLSEICHVESVPQPSVVQVLREISLKRHASREDVTFELAKKQRTDGVFSDGLENLEEMTQKRARDDSSRSEEDVSPQNKSLRPAKRSKMPSCHDILSSLSSSISVSSGVKRKAIDVSRSGTPDVGKHFKSLDSSHSEGTANPSLLSRSISEPAKMTTRLLNDGESGNSDRQRPNKTSLEVITHRGIQSKAPLPVKKSLYIANTDSIKPELEGAQREVKATNERTRSATQLPVKLTDKLFMKAEPKNIDKIKTLIEEHDSVTPRFTTDSTDEIKKSDIVNMRQTSMKNRLKSMFDAISGKATSKIDPEVVIQAEDKSTASQAIVASLSSSTSTTNVNTSPIATSAIVPIIGKSKTATSPAKHVTFQFADSSAKPATAEFPKFTAGETKATESVGETSKLENPVSEKASSTESTFICSNPTTSFTPLSIGSSIFTSAATSAGQQSLPSAPSEPPKSSVATNTLLGGSTTTASQSNTQTTNSTASTPLFGIPSSTMSKPVSTPLPSFSMQSNEKASQPAVSFSFGAPKTTAATASTPSALLSTPVSQVAFTSASSFLATTTSSGLFSFNPLAKPIDSVATSTPEAFKATEKKGFTFGGTAATASLGFQAAGITTTSQTSLNGSIATTSTGSGFNFSTTTAPSTIFGSPSTTTTTPSTGFSSTSSTSSGFTFGTSTTSAGTTKLGFSFGTTPATSSVAATSSSSVPSLSFGVTTTTTCIPVFGGPTTTSASAPLQPSIFGGPSTTASSTTLPSLFGTPSTTASTTTTTTATTQPSIFGAPAASSSGFTSDVIGSVFGTSRVQSKAFPTTTASTVFGTPKTLETPAPTPSFATTTKSSGIFSGVSTEANVTTSAAPLPSFGNSAFTQKPVTAFGANTSTSTFSGSAGNAAPSLFESQPTQGFGSTPSCASGTTPMYGFANTSATSFGTPSTGPPAFGGTNTSTTSFGATTTAAPTFGSLNTSTFGTPNSGVPTIGHQTATSPNFNPPSSAFGATTTAPPAFPTPSSSTFGGSSTTAGFGTNANPPPAFSTTTGFTRFGAAPNTTPFGTQATPANTSFGTTSTGNTSFGTNTNNTNTSFAFGASQPNMQQPQQNPVFTFSGGAAPPPNNATSGTTPFQFSSAAPQTGGFNFTGAPTTPAINFSKDGASGSSFALPTPGVNSFSAPPTGGMFSIGTGSTAPRSRPSRRRQR